MDFLKEKISEVFNKDKWEVKTLGEISNGNIFSGDSKIPNGYKDGGDFPAITNEDVSLSNTVIKNAKIFANQSFANGKTLIKKGDLLIVISGLSSDRLGVSCAYLGEEKCIAGGHVTFIKNHSQNPKYLVHLFSSQYVRKQIRALCKGDVRAHIIKEDIKKIKLLLPDLETQNRIVEFLDKFVHLKSELAFEKEKRMKQFEHYRNSIFGRNEEEILWEIRSLREIATEIYSGSEITKSQLLKEGYPAIRYSEIYNSNLFINKIKDFVNLEEIKNKKYCEFGDILIPNVNNKEDTLGKSAVYLGNEKCLIGQHIISIKHNQNPRYLSFACNSYFFINQIKQCATKGTVWDLALSKIKKLRIPLPDIETQNQIANSLSRFIELSSEIDCELKLTNKQYKYYKNAIFS